MNYLNISLCEIWIAKWDVSIGLIRIGFRHLFSFGFSRWYEDEEEETGIFYDLDLDLCFIRWSWRF